ncbi:uncharacterized protein LOC119693676 [Plutella xylostella]|uniref:uncharacterized protein LOC119693676 n=1 Tax=Plutella xylostella TaxID=51655 RepID=UPI002032D0AF|nr:uncharacterized protein LOC119693676 [Plutella xylostella]
MNLKLNNESRVGDAKKTDLKALTIKEERQRTGRYIAILVGILLFLLAIYHAWVRRIPFIASLIVPAIIMLIYVGWVLYTASRDKHRALDAEAALNAALAEEAGRLSCQSCHGQSNRASIISINSSKHQSEGSITHQSDNTIKLQSDDSNAVHKNNRQSEDSRPIIKPIILVNDEPAVIDVMMPPRLTSHALLSIEKFNGLPARRKYKRRFCRGRRNNVFKRSYSIA